MMQRYLKYKLTRVMLVVMLLITVVSGTALAKRVRVLLIPAQAEKEIPGEAVDTVTSAFLTVLRENDDVECQVYKQPLKFDISNPALPQEISAEIKGNWDILLLPRFDLWNIDETKRLRLSSLKATLLYVGYDQYADIFKYRYTGANPFIRATELKEVTINSIKSRLVSDMNSFIKDARRRDSSKIIEQLLGNPDLEIVKSLIEQYDALDIEPDYDLQSYVALGSSYYILQRYDKAETWLRKAYDIDPADPAILEPLGQALLKLKKDMEGLKTLDELYRVERRRQIPYLPLLRKLVKLSLDLNDSQRAVEYLTTLTDKQEFPDIPEAERLSALTKLYQLGKAASGSGAARRAVQLITGEAEGGYKSGRYQWSLDLLESVTPDLNSDGFFLKGLVLEKLGKEDDAGAAFLSVINLDRNNISAYAHIGRYYLDKGRKEELLALYAKAIETNGSLFALRYGLGIAYLLNSRWDEATVELMAAGSASPELFPLCQEGISNASYMKVKESLAPLKDITVVQLLKKSSSYMNKNFEWSGKINLINESRNYTDLYLLTSANETVVCRVASLPKGLNTGSKVSAIGSLTNLLRSKDPDGRPTQIPLFATAAITGQYNPSIPVD